KKNEEHYDRGDVMGVVRSLMFSALLCWIAAPDPVAANQPVLQKASSFVTTGGEDFRFKRIPQKTFTIADRLYFVTMVTWQPIDKGAGRHRLVWRWYSKGTLISEFKRTV